MRPTYGMIHGRFQPFHNEHLDYMRKTLERCQNLIAGITNPDPTLIIEDAANPHRHLSEANPFTFFQRLLMIKETLRDEGVPWERANIIPFPVHHPERWPYYVPKGTVHYMRVFSPWEEGKLQRFREYGWQVEVLDPCDEKRLSATEVRERLAASDGWQEMVPPGVARVIAAIKAGHL
ncbi:MAG: nicotinate-nucleotide adenylyltransferase [Dehalococcoidia bacterium]